MIILTIISYFYIHQAISSKLPACDTSPNSYLSNTDHDFTLLDINETRY